MSPAAAELTIGELSERSGVPASALRFYEREGLIHSRRTSGNQRRYHRTTLRRVAAFLLWPFLNSGGADAVVAAIAGQVRRVVYLSASSVHDGAPPRENGVWGQVEQAVEHAAAEWTFLRASGFATNTLAWADQIRSDGVVRWVYGQAARSLIHERDIADIAVRALTGAQHAGAKYVLTGPEAVTQADQVRIIGEVIGRPVRWEEAPPEAIREQLAAATGDHAFAEHALAYWAHLIDQPELVTDTVEKITGTRARTFRDWAQDHAGDFAVPPNPQLAASEVPANRNDGVVKHSGV